MTSKLIFRIFFAIVFLLTGVSCSEEISDCPNKLCVISGGWRLTEVQLDGDLFTGDYSGYQLVLNTPNPASEAISEFQRVNIGGAQETGTWSVENSGPGKNSFAGSILRLRPSNNDQLREDWEIESFTPRQMILVLRRDVTAKDGPALIRFVLVPF